MARPPKPAFLKALSGTDAPSRVREASPSSDPLGPDDAPPVALQLTRGARDIWRQLLEMLPRGLILRSDCLEFGRYCALLSDRVELREVLRQRGRTISLLDEGGNVRSEKPRPELSALHVVERELRLLGSLLGLQPSARQRVSVALEESDDALDRLLFD